MVYAISRNGMEPVQNILQDTETRNERYYIEPQQAQRQNYGGAIGCYSPFPPLAS